MKRFTAAAFLYAGLVALLTWPALTHLQDDILGDGGSYQFLWGLWWFGERLKDFAGSLWDCPVVLFPFGADLIQHDYPLAPYALARLLQKAGLTLTGSYNASFLAAFWLNALCTFVLTDSVVNGEDPRGGERSFLAPFTAGLAFAFASYFCTRAMVGHYGLLHAYSLPLTAFCLHKAHKSGAARWFLAAGCALVLAALSQYYYAVYAAGYVVLFYVWRSFSFRPEVTRRTRFYRAGTLFFMGLGALALVVSAGLAVFLTFRGSGTYRPLGQPVHLGSTTNPMVVWWLSWTIAFFLRFRFRLNTSRVPGTDGTKLSREWVWISLPLVFLTPLFWRAGRLLISGGFGAQALGWKSGPGGAYPLSVFLPNLTHVFWGAARPGWETFETCSIGLGWTALAAVLFTKAWKAHRWWTCAFLFSLLMSFGPFLRFIPKLDNGPVTPFWFFRYLPVVSGARMPSRWIALAWVGWSVLVAGAVKSLGSRRWRAACLAGVLLESLTIPFSPSPAAIPAAYSLLAEDRRPGAVLELPFKVSDGRKEWGSGGWADPQLYYQTLHHRPMVGGSLSRIPDAAFEEYRAEPVLQALVSWQEDREGAPALDRAGLLGWLEGRGISWVLVDKARARGGLTGGVKNLLGGPAYEDDRHLAWRT